MGKVKRKHLAAHAETDPGFWGDQGYKRYYGNYELTTHTKEKCHLLSITKDSMKQEVNGFGMLYHQYISVDDCGSSLLSSNPWGKTTMWKHCKQGDGQVYLIQTDTSRKDESFVWRKTSLDQCTRVADASGGKCDIDGGAHEVTNTTLEMYGALFKHMNDSTKRESTLTTSVKSSDKAKFEALSVENEKEAVLNIAKSFEKSVELVRSAEGEKKVFNMFCKKCMRYFEAVHDFSSI